MTEPLSAKGTVVTQL